MMRYGSYNTNRFTPLGKQAMRVTCYTIPIFRYTKQTEVAKSHGTALDN